MTAGNRFAAVLLFAVGGFFLLPLVVTVTNSFMAEAEIAAAYTTKLSVFDIAQGIQRSFVNIRLIPKEVTFNQYKSVLLYQPSFLILLINSVKLTVPVVVGNAVVSALAAYGFTAWRWKHKDILFFVYVLVMLMPLQAVSVPNYIIADKLQIKDSYLAIILPGIFAPFGTFLLTQSMKSLPASYFEAAQIDGANPVSIFLYIVLPQMKSGITALVMLVFIEYWNIVEQAVIFIKDYYREPLSVYLSRMADGSMGLVFAASCVYMFPSLWFLVVGQQDLQTGIELSGIK